MKKRILLFLIVSILITSITLHTAMAQSWNITGNNNATSSSKLGTTNLVPLKFFTNNNQRMVIDSLGKVGIGIADPINILTVKSSGGIPSGSWLNGLSSPIFTGFAEGVSSEFVLATAAGTSNRRSVFQGRRSRGTLTTPSVVLNDDYLTSLLASGYDGSTFQNPASVDIYVDGVPSAGNVPARISLVTGSNAGNRTERLKVGSTGNFDFNNGQLFLQQSNGSVGIGTATPDASSLFEVKSTTKGLLTSRMTQAQRDAIVSPAAGLLIYQTNNTPGFYYYTGSGWTAIASNIATAGWALSGNAGTNPATNFIGTTDAKSLVFKVNNVRAGYLDYDPAKGNASFGYQSLIANTTGINNTAAGYNSLFSNTTGYYNTANGNSSLYKNTDGAFNTANGYQALYQNTTGSSNTATGEGALAANTSGNYNAAFGERSLYNNNGSYNTANGPYSLYANTSGNFNTALGAFSFRFNGTGSNNTGVGYEVLASNNGNDNTALGYYSMYSNITGFSNVAIGAGALYKSTNAHNFVAVGDSALYNQGAIFEGGEFPHPGYNTALGSKALYSNTTGQYNTATGFQALNSNVTGESNTANGFQALYYNTAGRNSAFGTLSLYYNGVNATQYYDATGNTALGYTSLYNNTIGYNNTAAGLEALYNNSSGYNNAAFGLQALKSNGTGIGNTAVGVAADVNTFDLQNATAIGYFAVATASNQVMLGNTSVNSVKAAGSFTIYSDGRYKKEIKNNVPGLEFIKQLRPVTYHYDIHGMNEKMGIKERKQENNTEKTRQVAQEEAAIVSKEKKLYTGFIAQEVEAAAKKVSYDFSGLYVPQNDKDLYGLSYSDFVVPLVKAVQELSKMNDDKDAKIDALQNQNASLEARLEKIEGLLKINSSAVSLSNATLEQNIPNPFTNSTTINYSLPQKFTTAQIRITDKLGKTLKTINVYGSGRGTLNVDAAILSSGAYNYSLFVDSRLISTKQMERLR